MAVCKALNFGSVSQAGFKVGLIMLLTLLKILCRETVQMVLGLHDFDDFENGGQPEIYDVEQMIRVRIHRDRFAITVVHTHLLSLI